MLELKSVQSEETSSDEPDRGSPSISTQTSVCRYVIPGVIGENYRMLRVIHDHDRKQMYVFNQSVTNTHLSIAVLQNLYCFYRLHIWI